MKHYGIVITEIIDDEPNGKFPLLRPRHHEKDFFQIIIPESSFDFEYIFEALLKSMKEAKNGTKK